MYSAKNAAMLSTAMRMYYDYVTEQSLFRKQSRLLADVARGTDASTLNGKLRSFQKEWADYFLFTGRKAADSSELNTLKARYERLIGMSMDSPEFQDRMNKTIEHMRNRNA